ncbi:MAG TPA: hypothetical protein VG673_14930, partial [Actinomycetota bacterium]|nr:hypothetical protein [Actinomycetota bacterium]
QFDISFDSIFEMLDFLSVLQAQPFQEVHFSKVTITASADELYRRYRIDKVLHKTGPNRFVEASSRRHPRGGRRRIGLLRGHLLPVRPGRMRAGGRREELRPGAPGPRPSATQQPADRHHDHRPGARNG